jgi:hypothetical protein
MNQDVAKKLFFLSMDYKHSPEEFNEASISLVVFRCIKGNVTKREFIECVEEVWDSMMEEEKLREETNGISKNS